MASPTERPLTKVDAQGYTVKSSNSDLLLEFIYSLYLSAYSYCADGIYI